MNINTIISTIDKYAERWHKSDEAYENGEDQDIMLLIGEYIIHKGHDHLIGKYMFSAILHVFEEQVIGQNDEAFCGYEETLLINAIQMYSDIESLNTLTDNDPIEGEYRLIDHGDKEIYMLINYFEASFWPDSVEMRYNLNDFKS